MVEEGRVELLRRSPVDCLVLPAIAAANFSVLAVYHLYLGLAGIAVSIAGAWVWLAATRRARAELTEDSLRFFDRHGKLTQVVARAAVTEFRLEGDGEAGYVFTLYVDGVRRHLPGSFVSRRPIRRALSAWADENRPYGRIVAVHRLSMRFGVSVMAVLGVAFALAAIAAMLGLNDAPWWVVPLPFAVLFGALYFGGRPGFRVEVYERGLRSFSAAGKPIVELSAEEVGSLRLAKVGAISARFEGGQGRRIKMPMLVDRPSDLLAEIQAFSCR